MAKKIFPFAIVLLFAFIAGFPLLQAGFPPTHDGEYHVVRFYEFDKTLRDGNWYPRWAADLNNGYGVPLFNFVYPLPNYVASFFHFFGFSFIDSFKLNMFFALILGALFFYLWSKKFWGVWGGIVGSIFYTYSPYHFLDIYIRGSVGEVWALAFFPAFLWSVTEFVREKKQYFLPISSVFLAFIIFSHNILALMFLPFALVYIAFLVLQSKYKKFLILNTIYIILIGLGLSSVFWLPAIFERHYALGLEIFGFENHFPEVYQLVFPSWGSGFSGGGLGSSLSFQIGVANLLVVFLSLIFVFLFKKSRNRSIVIFFLILFFTVVFLMLKISLTLWKTIPFMNYFQFPWRFLSIEILIASFLAGSVVFLFTQPKLIIPKSFIALVLILFAFSLGIGYAKPAHYLYRDDNYYISRSNFIDSTNSPGNSFNTVYFRDVLKKKKEKLSFIVGGGDIESKEVKTQSYLFGVKVNSSSEIQVNTAYFPGWVVFVNDEKTKTKITDDGLFSFELPKGNHQVKVIFKNTPIRTFSIFIFYISVIILLALFIKRFFATIKK